MDEIWYEQVLHCANFILACSRLQDSGEKSFSTNKCEKRARAGERQDGGDSLSHFSWFQKSRQNYHSRSLASVIRMCEQYTIQ